MLSFQNGNHIAYAINNNGKKIYDIYVKPDNKGKSDIVCENIVDILNDSDIKSVSKSMKLNRIEEKVLKNALKLNNKNKLNDKLKSAYDIVIETLNDKLKEELEFDDDLKIIPSIGHKDVPYDRSIFIVGPANAGKSHLIGEILKHDLRKRPIYLFTVEKNKDDPAYQKLLYTEDDYEKMSEGKIIKNGHRMTYIPIVSDEDLLNIPTMEDLTTNEGVICVFDDLEGFKSYPIIYEALKLLMEDMLECARKKNITVISAQHELDAKKCKTNINECEYITLFPSSNRILSEKFLKNGMSISKKDRESIIEKGAKNRYMILKMSNPMLVITQHTISLIRN